MSNNIKTVHGIQALLIQAADALTDMEKRDMQWVRALVATSNSANSLLRTQLQQEDNKRSTASRTKKAGRK